ncbi:MAG: Ig-like domain-containing protein [candidate division KSB1 bacterium]|nr:Ig-like domain-containing protein [candidate division KSB1 bacterium]MDZ7399933.1 Ig-like domain-containing protein [candidate division KSB1 bacterium]
MKNCHFARIRLIATFIISLSFTSGALAGGVIVSWDPNSEPDLLGYKVYWGTSSRNYSNVKDVGKLTNYTIQNLAEGAKYFFAVTAYDTAYNESDFSVEVSYTVPISDNTPPEIASASLKSSTELELVYTEPVEKSSAEMISNYQISGGVSIISVTLNVNQSSVRITTSPHQSGSYIITVNHVKDLAGNEIQTNSTASYQMVPEDLDPPTITGIQILDANHVDVTFSEPINKATAENISNYSINNGVSILQAKLDQNGKTVHLTTSNHQPNVNYTLMINNICDLATKPNYIKPNSSISYQFIVKDTTPPEIYSVTIRNESLVDVVFSEKIEQTSAETVTNYQINHGVKVLVAILDINQTTVHLSTTVHAANLSYEIRVSNIRDLASPANVINPNSSYRYDYYPDDHIPPTIVNAVAVDEYHVDVTFSEMVARETAENKNNFQIDKGIIVVEAKLDTNKRIVHLTTSAHQTGETYTLRAKNIKDLSPNANVIADNAQIQYLYVYQDREAPRLENITVVYSTYLKLTFNETLDRQSAEHAGNYLISGAVKVLSAVLDNNLKVVHLTTSEHQPNINYTMTINEIRDGSPNRNRIAPNTTIQYKFEVQDGAIVIGLSKENYEFAYLDVGDRYYVDRNYTITSIPEAMKGYLWIKTANDDRSNMENNFLSFQLREAAKIYVAYDSRAVNYPDWLVNDFYRIGKYIGVSEYASKLDLWERECEPGIITVGGNLAPGAQGAESMYVLLIENKNAQRPGNPENMEDPLSLGPANMFLLYQNYPNPFNAGTEIRIQLPQEGDVELAIYNLLGQTIKILAQGHKSAGHYIFRWDGKHENGEPVPTGTYFSRLTIKQIQGAQDHRRTSIVYHHVRKMILIK